MGTISQGVLGGFSGKVGNIVGGTWKGIDYMRIKPASVANPRTAGQVDQRSKFALVLNFLQPMTEFLRVGFKNYAVKMTQFNSAMSYTLNNAVTGAYPDFLIDYSKALVSRGTLLGAANAAASYISFVEVEFTWVDNSGTGSANATDHAIALLYNKEKKLVVSQTYGELRSAGSQVMIIPSELAGTDLEAFIGFISEDGTLVANSTYVGTITYTP